MKFSRDLPGQNVKFLFFVIITGTLQFYKTIVEIVCIVKFVQEVLLYC